MAIRLNRVANHDQHRATAMIATILILSIVLWIGTHAWATPPVDSGSAAHTADLVIINGEIWTGTAPPNEKQVPAQQPTALAVKGVHITAVGNDASIRTRIGPGTQVIDAKGRRVIPGMTDSHAHVIGGGQQLARMNLRDVRSREEFIRAVAAEAKTRQPGHWVQGGRWSIESWDKPEPPNRSWLDSVTGDVPVFLKRMDGHQALVNSAALKLAGIDAAGPVDPPGGEIERDPKTREPTGILKELATDLVGDLIPDSSPDELYEALLRAMKHANALGVTSVHDMCNPEHLEVYRRAHSDGTITIRLTSFLQADDWSDVVDKVADSDLQHEMVRLVGLKGYMDGSMGSRTAYMRETYSDSATDEPYPKGQLTPFGAACKSLRWAAAEARARGLQLAVHAIGDEANHLLLNGYESLLKGAGGIGPRPRVEHAQHLLVSDIPRFAKLGVVASMQPFHKADDGRYAEEVIGKNRLEGSYAFRRIVDSGALLCFGSDWPVATMNPFAGIDSAVTARTLDGKTWLPSHSLTVEEALRAYTVSPPKAIGLEDQLGTLEVGKLADIVILADDPFAVPAERLSDVKVDTTIVDGKVVYSRPD